MPLRRMPYVGAPVTVLFLARRVPGVVEEVADGARRVVVLTEEDELIAFELSPSTGKFAEAGRPVGGARLAFDDG